MSLQDLVQGWAARGFADFPGLAIDGSIPLKQELVNQLIAEALAAATSGGSATPSFPAPLGPVMLQLVKKVEVTATDGVITVHLNVRA